MVAWFRPSSGFLVSKLFDSGRDTRTSLTSTLSWFQASYTFDTNLSLVRAVLTIGMVWTPKDQGCGPEIESGNHRARFCCRDRTHGRYECSAVLRTRKSLYFCVSFDPSTRLQSWHNLLCKSIRRLYLSSVSPKHVETLSYTKR